MAAKNQPKPTGPAAGGGGQAAFEELRRMAAVRLVTPCHNSPQLGAAPLAETGEVVIDVRSRPDGSKPGLG